LNRALLARQLLLHPSKLSTERAIEHLVGMQAQAPLAPYVGLWARLDGFSPATLAQSISGRRAVRMTLMRTTIHLVTARDCLRLRPVLQPALERGFRAGSRFGRRLDGVDLGEVLAVGRALLGEEPRTIAALVECFRERWPGGDPWALAQAVRHLVPLVQVPPRGLWGAAGPARWTTVERWLGRPIEAGGAPEEMVLRYLAAFGPATARDVRAWSHLPRAGDVLRTLRPKLRAFRDEAGNELYDVRGGPLPDADTPAPIRFLPEYDNLLLSHADRSRVIAGADRDRVFTRGSVLVDGFVRGAWRITRAARAATLEIEPLGRMTKGEREAVAEHGAGLLAFAAEEATVRDVRFGPP
jgi:Winged helix DNA-binding domain